MNETLFVSSLSLDRSKVNRIDHDLHKDIYVMLYTWASACSDSVFDPFDICFDCVSFLYPVICVERVWMDGWMTAMRYDMCLSNVLTQLNLSSHNCTIRGTKNKERRREIGRYAIHFTVYFLNHVRPNSFGSIIIFICFVTFIFFHFCCCCNRLERRNFIAYNNDNDNVDCVDANVVILQLLAHTSFHSIILFIT